MNPDIIRIGLTMRVMEPRKYHEPRDALAHDWYAFMSHVLPELQWLALPNIGNEIIAYIRHWNIHGVILTGGNDIGSVPIRDETEYDLIDFCVKNGYPLFGVCRGLQMLQTYMNGALSSCDPKKHVAVTHEVDFCNVDVLPEACRMDRLETNSYHDWSVKREDLSDGLIPFALTEDGYVEGMIAANHPITAVMWHPERHPVYLPFDKTLIRNHFGLE